MVAQKGSATPCQAAAFCTYLEEPSRRGGLVSTSLEELWSGKFEGGADYAICDGYTIFRHLRQAWIGSRRVRIWGLVILGVEAGLRVSNGEKLFRCFSPVLGLWPRVGFIEDVQDFGV